MGNIGKIAFKGVINVIKKAFSRAKTDSATIDISKNIWQSAMRSSMDKSCAAKGLLSELEKTELFPFAKFHPLETAAGKLREDGMILCHMTEHLPTSDGKILSIFEALGETRNSVHFSVNHPVVSHTSGYNWTTRPYAILMPMRPTLRHPKNRFLGGIATDFFSAGSVTMPKGTVIVRHAKDLPAGKFRVLDASKIERFKKLKGIRIIETSEANIHKASKTVMRKLGYEVRNGLHDATGFLWGDFDKVHENAKKFFDFLRKKGMRPMFHSYTPNGMLDITLLDMGILSTGNKSWYIMSDSKVIYDYKKSVMDMLNEILRIAKKENLPVNYDVNAIKRIVLSSASPKEALLALEKELKIKCKTPLLVDESGREALSTGDLRAFLSHKNLEYAMSEQNSELLEKYIEEPSESLYHSIFSNIAAARKKLQNSSLFKFLTGKEPELVALL